MSNGKIGVIIPAGGSGSRMGGVYKPLEKLCGKEMLLYSLETFEKCCDVEFVVISAKEEKIQEIEKLCRDNCCTKVKKVVQGGIDRQCSVVNAFRCGLFDDENVEYVAIHDAARPLFNLSMAKKVFDEVKLLGTAVCACKVRDTIKKTDDEGYVVSGVDREGLWLMQTPQVFKKELYKRAVDYAEKSGFTATDDSSLVINLGEKVHLCDTPSSNIKITYPEDTYLANAIINYERTGKNKCE